MLNHFIATFLHKFWVVWYITKACYCLLKRALIHDMSKFEDPEAKGFAELLPELNSTTYGSEEYQELLAKLKPVLRHHYQENSHHPQYYDDDNGFARMSFLDKVEMLCDWKAATLRHDDGDLRKSINVNQKRFNYNNFDKRSMLRDAKEIGLI